MRDYMIKRALMSAERFGTSKSTVHKDATERLKDIDHALYLKVKSVLEFNLSERHLRGGVATREKYLRQKEEKSAH